MTEAQTSGADSTHYDLIVIGAGCAGFVTAIRAHSLGLKTLLIEKMDRPAGNTTFATGFLLGINTKLQEGKGLPQDSVEDYCTDMMAVSKQKASPQLTRYVAEHCNEAIEWLHDFVGVKFATGMKLIWPVLTRGHLVVGEHFPGGRQLAHSLWEKAKAIGLPIAFNTKVLKLLEDEATGGVCGCRIKDEEGCRTLKSKYGVVLATGGFSANQALVTTYMGSGAAKMPLRGSSTITGDNLRFSDPFFAKFVNMDQYHCGPIYSKTGENPLFIANNGVIVNADGERYTDEGQTYVQIARDTGAKTAMNQGYIICDQTIREKPALQIHFKEYVDTGAPLYTGETLEEAARQAGLNVANVVATVEGYNAAIEKYQGATLTPPNTLTNPPRLLTPPYSIVPFEAGMTATFGGPLINTQAQVLDTEGRSIDGLFAVGNAAGGLFYDDYGGGGQLTSATVFGLACAAYVKEQKEQTP